MAPSELGGMGPSPPGGIWQQEDGRHGLGTLIPDLRPLPQDLIMYSKCQRLFRSPSMPCGVIRPILKRLERPQDRDWPIQSKRRRSVTPPEEHCEAEEHVSALLGCVWPATLRVHSASPCWLGLWQRAGCLERRDQPHGAPSPLTVATICLAEGPCPPFKVLVSQ